MTFLGLLLPDGLSSTWIQHNGTTGCSFPLTALVVKGVMLQNNERIIMLHRKVTQQRHFEQPRSLVKGSSQVGDEELASVSLLVALHKHFSWRTSRLLPYRWHSPDAEQTLRFYLKTGALTSSVATFHHWPRACLCPASLLFVNDNGSRNSGTRHRKWLHGGKCQAIDVP